MSEGRHWSFDGSTLRIFDVFSYAQDKELYIGESRDCMTKVMEHERASQTISGRLTYLENACGNYQILNLQINEYMAHLLFAEGFLSVAKLESAIEDMRSISVPMTFKSRLRLIAIRSDLSQAVVYFGPSGKPLNID